MTGLGAALIDFDWTAHPASDGPASTQDVSCHLSKRLTGPELVEALEAVCDHQGVEAVAENVLTFPDRGTGGG